MDDEGDFLKSAEENFTAYYQPLIPWVNRMRRVVFPCGARWKKLDPQFVFSNERDYLSGTEGLKDNGRVDYRNVVIEHSWREVQSLIGQDLVQILSSRFGQDEGKLTTCHIRTRPRRRGGMSGS
jgi:hypothetical protein